MTLIKYKNPTEYGFYKWIREYPESKEWHERIEKYPELKLQPLLEEDFYVFMKIAFKNRATSFLNWEKIEKKILKEINCLEKDDLKELKNIFEHLIRFYKTSALRQGFSRENFGKVKKGHYLEKGVEKGKFYEKELPINEPEGVIAVYDEKTKKYKKLT